MKITHIGVQARDPNRVNVSVDGKYKFSLDMFQLVELGIKTGQEYSEEEMASFENESRFGKLYARALEYTLMRPHSAKEVRDYLWRKTRATLTKDGQKREGYPVPLTERVFNRLLERGYIDDEKFARYWVENRNQTKGSSKRKLINELRVKGVNTGIIEQAFSESERSDEDEIQKIIAKKRNKYPDDQKLMQYLARQGFSFDDIKSALANERAD